MKSRRIVMALLALLAGLATQPASGSTSQTTGGEATDSDPPNILFIITDDQRGGMEVMPRTLQLFKREGRSYPNAFVTTPLCCPSRLSMITGLYAHNHGVTDNAPDPARLSREDTLQAKLSTLGYKTAVYGKFLNRWPVETNPPHFEDFAIMGGSYRDTNWNVNGQVGVIPGYTTDIVGDRAVDFIEAQRNSERPWMMLVGPNAPHSPFTPEPAFANARIDNWNGNPAVRSRDRRGKPARVRRAKGTLAEGRSVRERQYRTLMSVDRMVERVFGSLRRVGQNDNTLAVYISDNGHMWGEHGLLKKGVPYTQAAKVPMFARWPQSIEPGTVDRRLVANIDLAPTVLGLLSRPTESLDGRNLLDGSWNRDRMHLEYWCNIGSCNRWASTRTKSSQYVEYYTASGDVKFREYYDLKADPWQLRNLLKDGMRRNDPPLRRLQEQLARDRTCAGTAVCP